MTIETDYDRALEIMGLTPAVLDAIVGQLPAEALDRQPAPDVWSVRDVLTHMLRSEATAIQPRIQAMLNEDNPELPAAAPITPPEGLRDIVEQWKVARARNLEFFRGIPAERRDRTGRHARFGALSVREHIVEWAYHDLDHVRQILAVLQAELYPAIAPFHPLYPSPV